MDEGIDRAWSHLLSVIRAGKLEVGFGPGGPFVEMVQNEVDAFEAERSTLGARIRKPVE
jgi:hypothetical protein